MFCAPAGGQDSLAEAGKPAPSTEFMKHKWKQILGKHTEKAFSGDPEYPVSSLHIPSWHMCKQTAGTEDKQQLEPIPNKPPKSTLSFI